ncbi:methyltransferase [Terrihabitans soli]|uniref:Methyltransferase n=1 Tax=Terrihabitans soli TaxID=708113 RepID=A0A6S6QU78_9HYPH|nr:class I SAM-dependent methyltransferase [Terrihabitans soli]BCJ90631.1 methyltransferase [Terrihabitans soli]
MTEEAARISGLYERYADAYDRLRGRSLFERAWLGRFIALLPEPRTVLDLGCGMGEPMAHYLIGQGCKMTGLDSSAAMIERCRARFPEHLWHVGDMRNFEQPEAFSGVLAWDSFFHLTGDDQRKMFSVFKAQAAPGAALMFTSGPSAGEAIGEFEGEPLYHASLDPAEYQELLAANGFEVLSYAAHDPECGGHTVWLARRP